MSDVRFARTLLIGLVVLGLIVVSMEKSVNCKKFATRSNPSSQIQTENYGIDLTKSEDHWIYNRRGREYAAAGDYLRSIDEYKKAIDVIQNSPDNAWPNLKKEDGDMINKQSKVDKQIFSRYRLIEVMEKAGQYKEAISHVEWLQENQVIKGKEELLKGKLEKMKNDILVKMRTA